MRAALGQGNGAQQLAGREAPEVGVGGVAEEVGDAAGVDVGVLLNLARELTLVIEARARQVAPALIEVAPVLL